MANLPKIALGAWAWRNDGTFGNNLTAESLKPIFDTAMENGLNLWDTAYAYGMGTSEKVLAGFLKGLPRESYLGFFRQAYLLRAKQCPRLSPATLLVC